jgi:hypothetical protein
VWSRGWRIRPDDCCRDVCAPLESGTRRHAKERHVCATRWEAGQKSLCDNSVLRVIPRSPPFLVADDEESRTALKTLRARFLAAMKMGTPSPGPRRLMKARSWATLSPKGGEGRFSIFIHSGEPKDHEVCARNGTLNEVFTRTQSLALPLPRANRPALVRNPG